MGDVSGPWDGEHGPALAPRPAGEAGTQQLNTWLAPASRELWTRASPEGSSPSCPALPCLAVHHHLLPSLPRCSPQALFHLKSLPPSPFAFPAPSQSQGTRGCHPQPRQALRMVPPWLPPLPPQAL